MRLVFFMSGVALGILLSIALACLMMEHFMPKGVGYGAYEKCVDACQERHFSYDAVMPLTGCWCKTGDGRYENIEIKNEKL